MQLLSRVINPAHLAPYSTSSLLISNRYMLVEAKLAVHFSHWLNLPFHWLNLPFHFITYSLGCGASSDSSDILA